MKPYDVVLLTERRYECPVEPNWYEQNILTEDGYVMAALEGYGSYIIVHTSYIPIHF